MPSTDPCGTAFRALRGALGQAGTIVPTMEIHKLNDDELATSARDWRLRALRGEKDARGMAHELEREVRRRAALRIDDDIAPTQQAPSLEMTEQAPRRAWKFWAGKSRLNVSDRSVS